MVGLKILNVVSPEKLFYLKSIVFVFCFLDGHGKRFGLDSGVYFKLVNK